MISRFSSMKAELLKSKVSATTQGILWKEFSAVLLVAEVEGSENPPTFQRNVHQDLLYKIGRQLMELRYLRVFNNSLNATVPYQVSRLVQYLAFPSSMGTNSVNHEAGIQDLKSQTASASSVQQTDTTSSGAQVGEDITAKYYLPRDNPANNLDIPSKIGDQL
ncbi:hypothetical protein LINPERHAP1_LOCUS26289 [Linum perenne]